MNFGDFDFLSGDIHYQFDAPKEDMLLVEYPEEHLLTVLDGMAKKKVLSSI